MGLLMVGFIALLVAGPLFSSIAEAAGIDESTSARLVSLLRYPVGLLALFAAFLLLYWRGPRRRARRPGAYVPGAALRLRPLGARLGRVLPLRLQLSAPMTRPTAASER